MRWYFVVFETGEAFTTGRAEVPYSKPIEGLNDLHAIEAFLKTQGYNNPFIVSWQRFEEGEDE